MASLHEDLTNLFENFYPSVRKDLFESSNERNQKYIWWVVRSMEEWSSQISDNAASIGSGCLTYEISRSPQKISINLAQVEKRDEMFASLLKKVAHQTRRCNWSPRRTHHSRSPTHSISPLFARNNFERPPSTHRQTCYNAYKIEQTRSKAVSPLWLR
jgi:hypothetical protein